MLNNIVLIGRLTKDPSLSYTSSGKAVCSMRLAVDRGTKDAEGKNEADFIDVVVWERQAETVANYLQKGRLAAVQGRLQIRQFEKDGQKREKAEVVASQVRFLDRGNDEQAPRREAPGVGSEPNFHDDDVPWS